ncbi:hypothetical protein E2C01_067350 [Portunus trituberculatus]|uniref:Uncharacterized protein n=1 Tax=Portunus trituberculatus TaxID=210409 RepID=A0A5B7HX78_PORTR|nr:hypothetical protein [Portunus trituberculatus]
MILDLLSQTVGGRWVRLGVGCSAEGGLATVDEDDKPPLKETSVAFYSLVPSLPATRECKAKPPPFISGPSACCRDARNPNPIAGTPPGEPSCACMRMIKRDPGGQCKNVTCQARSPFAC